MTHSARKREAPATALPNLQLDLDVLNEQLSGTEGTIAPDERRRVTERRNALAAQIQEVEAEQTALVEGRHPSESNASRRARGGWRCEVWMPEEYRDKLDALCEESGFSRAEQIEALIDFETSELARIKTKKPASSG